MTELTPPGLNPRLQTLWRNIVFMTVLIVAVAIVSLSFLYFQIDPVIVDLVHQHFASIYGVPAAAAAALFIVLVTRAVSGAMSVEFFGLRFHGAASETIMWVICFLAISYAVQSTWKLEYQPSGYLSQIGRLTN